LYEAHCHANDLIDFAELLVRSYELLKNNPALLSHYQTRFAHILVDEFQDTNTMQLRFEFRAISALEAFKILPVER
jgi:DNA helicase-2/ATP-dependent DNA helicase PcrA